MTAPSRVCCDLHGPNCEPPTELCCRECSEAAHPRHPLGIACTWSAWPAWLPNGPEML